MEAPLRCLSCAQAPLLFMSSLSGNGFNDSARDSEGILDGMTNHDPCRVLGNSSGRVYVRATWGAATLSDYTQLPESDGACVKPLQKAIGLLLTVVLLTK